MSTPRLSFLPVSPGPPLHSFPRASPASQSRVARPQPCTIAGGTAVIAPRCVASRRVAPRRTTPRRVALCRAALRRAALRRVALRCVAPHCPVPHYAAPRDDSHPSTEEPCQSLTPLLCRRALRRRLLVCQLLGSDGLDSLQLSPSEEPEAHSPCSPSAYIPPRFDACSGLGRGGAASSPVRPMRWQPPDSRLPRAGGLAPDGQRRVAG